MRDATCRGRAARLLLLASLASGALAAAERTPPALSPAPPANLGFSAERLGRIDRYLEGEVAAGRKAGTVVLVARNGKLAYSRAVGPADIASGRPLRTDDYFRWASMTKMVTSVALLTLYEQGKFQLTDPLSKYIPAFKDVRVYAGLEADGTLKLVAPARPITIQDVFRHTAGFSYVFGEANPVDKAYAAAGLDYGKLDSLADLVERLAKQPLLDQPGTRYNYSFAHDVQGYLVEYFSGKRLDEYFRQAIFGPLGMRETQFGVRADAAARYPTVYAADGKGGLKALTGGEHGDSYVRLGEHPFGGYGLSGTAQDYLRLALMLLNGGELGGVRILGRKTVELMTADHLPPTVADIEPGLRHGLGVWRIADPAEAGNLGSAGAYGRAGVATTELLNDPKQQLAILLCAQFFPRDQAFIDTVLALVYQALER